MLSADPLASPSPQPDAPGERTRLRLQVRALVSGIHPPAAVALLLATALLSASHHWGGTGFFREHFAGRFSTGPRELYPYLYWFGASLALYGAIPLVAAALTPGQRVRETGVGLGDWRAGLGATAALLALFLPVLYLAARHPAFAGHYPLCSAARTSWRLLLIYEAGYVLYFVGWEYLFRGYLLFALEPAMGRLAAFVTTMPFALMHFGKPLAEVFGSIIAGIALALLALRTRSFWYGTLLHVAVALSMDLLVAGPALLRGAGG